MPEYPRSPFEKTGASITPKVDGDTLDATPIGETTPAAGSFTTLTSTTNKLDATVAPTVNDDIDLGYVVSSRWIDVTNDKEYVCLDNTDGAAVWTETTASSSDVINDTSPQLGGNLDMRTYKLVGEGGSIGVYIDSDGKVGIGTITPSDPLTVQTVGTSGINILSGATDISIIRMNGSWTLSRNNTSVRLDGDELPVNITGAGGTVRASYKHTASSVNYLEYTGSVTGSGVTMATVGSDTNIDIILEPKGTGSVGIGTNSPTAILDINSNILRLRTAKTPATAGADGNQGDIAWDANYLYVCVSTNTWKRSALSTW